MFLVNKYMRSFTFNQKSVKKNASVKELYPIPSSIKEKDVDRDQ